MWRLWFVAFAGCYTATPRAGVPCDPDRPNCPGGQLCVASAGGFVCDRMPGDMIDSSTPPIDMSSSNDVDGDGIVNAADNCPLIANANQYNEDADGTGDACDKCPVFADTGADQDNDGVGDSCDPHVLIPGDSIAFFEPFRDASAIAGWTAVGGWSVTNGNLISTAVANNLNTLVTTYTAAPHETIYSQATITALTQDAGGSIGVVEGFDGDDGVHCGGGRSGTGEELFALINAAGGTFIKSANHPFAVSTLYRLTFDRADNAYSCSTILPNNNTLTVSETTNAGTGTKIGFRNRIASASFPWILVVKSP